MDMMVPRGSIYGLLGPSGCGKTTLIKCILGIKTLSSGEMVTFGHRTSGVQGARVGYMPQELALNSDLTMKETLQFYGRIFDMGNEKVKSRIQFLVDLLDLISAEDRVIVNLSGGQQRRVSLAVALLHEPELLLLDEPTDGVDPMLRRCIWSYLLDLSRTKQTTIVITTHYIEEARNAKRVGMMRSGRLLAEGDPDVLLRTYQMPTLEALFMHLCSNVINVETSSTCLPPGGPVKSSVGGTAIQTMPANSCCCKGVSLHKVNALFIKNMIRVRRNTMFLILMFIVPSLLFSVYFFTIGRSPTGMTVAVFNEENANTTCCISGQQMEGLGCRYLSHLDPAVISPAFFDNLPDALQSVRDGQNCGVLHFKDNFTDALSKRCSQMTFDEDILDQRDMTFYPDMADQLMHRATILQLTDAYHKFSQEVQGESCEMPSFPIVFAHPISGRSQLTEFFAPAVIMYLVYVLSVGFTALATIEDKREGVLDRFWACDVTLPEAIMAHSITNVFIVVVQTSLAMIVMTSALTCQGSITLIMSIILLQGNCGMLCGYVISFSCDSDQAAIQVTIALAICQLFLSGIVWPLEGMPGWLRCLSNSLPNTQAGEALRSISARGWDWNWLQVRSAYISTTSWSLIFLVLVIVIANIRKG